MRMGPRYSIQNTISHLICLPKFLTVRVLVGILAIFIGISLSVSTCLVQPSLQESSCCRTGIFVCFFISSLIHLIVLLSSPAINSCRSLQFMVRFRVISSIYQLNISIFISQYLQSQSRQKRAKMSKKQNQLFDVGKLSEASLRKYQSYFQLEATNEQLRQKVKEHFNRELQADLNNDIEAFLEIKREERGYRKRIARITRPPASQFG